MELFIITNNIARPHPMTVLLPNFKDIWDRDESEKKSLAIREYSYIEAMVSKKKSNPFKGYDESIRSHKILQWLFPNENYEPDEIVKAAMEYYEKEQEEASPYIRLYKSAKGGLDKLAEFLNEVDLNERDEKNKPIYKPKDVTMALQDVSKVLSAFSTMEKQVEEQLFTSNKTKGDKEINHFEM